MPRQQVLLTDEIRAQLPRLGTHVVSDDLLIVVRLFSFDDGGGEWLVAEFDGDDTLFGYVRIGMQEGSWRHVSLADLQHRRACGGLLQAVERDLTWTPTRWGDCAPRQKEKWWEELLSGMTPEERAFIGED